MYVWLHSSSPPQHIANVPETTVATSAKLREYMAQVNAQRLVNLKCAGIWENERGETRVCLFWTPEQMGAYIARNDVPIIGANL